MACRLRVSRPRRAGAGRGAVAVGAQKRVPCAKCPFRTDVAPYLNKPRARKIAAALRNGMFHCHATVDYAGDGDGHATAKSDWCNGALIVKERDGSLDANQMARISMRLGMLDPSTLDLDAPVFDSMAEWIKAQPKLSRAALSARGAEGGATGS